MTINKTIAALLIGINAWGVSVVASPSSAITAPEWMALVGVVLTALGVYQIANQVKTPPTSKTYQPVSRGVPIGGVVEQQPVPPVPVAPPVSSPPVPVPPSPGP